MSHEKLIWEEREIGEGILFFYIGLGFFNKEVHLFPSISKMKMCSPEEEMAL